MANDEPLEGAWGAPTEARLPPREPPPAAPAPQIRVVYAKPRTSPLTWVAAAVIVPVAGLCFLGMLSGDPKPAEAPRHALSGRTAVELRTHAERLRTLARAAYAQGDVELAKQATRAADALADGQADAVDAQMALDVEVALHERGLR